MVTASAVNALLALLLVIVISPSSGWSAAGFAGSIRGGSSIRGIIIAFPRRLENTAQVKSPDLVEAGGSW